MAQQSLSTRGATLDGVEAVAAVYTFRDGQRVTDFLAQHPHLMPLLIEAHPQIVRKFGPETPLSLEVITDREDEDDQELFAFIETTTRPDEAMPRLDRLRDEWWIQASRRSHNLLEFSLRYV